jgi:hypothetical protein
MLRGTLVAFALVGLVGGCGNDSTPIRDAAVVKDVGTKVDLSKTDLSKAPDGNVKPDTKATADTGAACGSCHSLPPATGHHALHVTSKSIKCSVCHSEVVNDSNQIINSTLHNNGQKNVKGSFTWSSSTKQCSNGCHGTKTW